MKVLLPFFGLAVLLLFAAFRSSDLAPSPAIAIEAPPPSADTTTAAPSIVVAELFTSQGCSSCPAADRVLAELAAREDTALLPLSFHVDYWNYLGWKDPFSDPRFSARQRDYDEQLGSRTYTPQLVINGRTELIGSRRAEVLAAVTEARTHPGQHTLAVTGTRAGRRVDVTAQLAGPRPLSGGKGKMVFLAVVPEATSSIERGENRGRELHHVNVVRAMEERPAASETTASLLLPDDLNDTPVEVVGLLQREDGAVLTARKTKP